MSELREFDEVAKRVQAVYHTLPDKAATIAVNFIKKRFIEQNWIDNLTEAWKRRKLRGKKREQRAILTKTGRLRRSIRKGKVTPDYAIIETDVPYARVHNEGFRGTVNVKVHKRNRYKNVKTKEGTGVYSVKSRKERQRTRTTRETSNTHWVQSHKRRVNMPRRQYMGVSAYMNRDIQRMMTAAFIKALKR